MILQYTSMHNILISGSEEKIWNYKQLTFHLDDIIIYC